MNLISPESRIIVVSGVLDQDRFQNENPELKILGAYQKPIALETLYRIVEQAMKEKKDEP